MLTSAAVALLVERLAYRPLIRRGSPKLVILISSIGASFALAEIMGLRDKFAAWFGLEDNLADYVAQARNVYSSPVTVDPHKVFEFAGYGVTDVDLLVIGAALAMMFALDRHRAPHPLGPRHPIGGPGPRGSCPDGCELDQRHPHDVPDRRPDGGGRRARSTCCGSAPLARTPAS